MMEDDFNQDDGGVSPERLIALWREGRIPRESLTRAERSRIMREMAGKRRTHGAGSGRPRTVEHRVGPRGGCPCAECRRPGRLKERESKKKRVVAEGMAGYEAPLEEFFDG